MKCDGCGKEMLREKEVALLLQIPDFSLATQRTLGKYYGTKVGVKGVLAWTFCFECVLDKLLPHDKSKWPSYCRMCMRRDGKDPYKVDECSKAKTCEHYPFKDKYTPPEE